MGPERTASRISKLINNLADKIEKKKEPDVNLLRELNAMLDGYAKIVATITPKEIQTPLNRESVEAWIQRNGRPGAYESLLE